MSSQQVNSSELTARLVLVDDLSPAGILCFFRNPVKKFEIQEV
jgi:hypothetical protein